MKNVVKTYEKTFYLTFYFGSFEFEYIHFFPFFFRNFVFLFLKKKINHSFNSHYMLRIYLSFYNKMYLFEKNYL